MKIVKFIKNNILGFIIGAILFGGIGIAVAVQSNIVSSDIAYTNSKNANVTSVKQAVDDLYGKVKKLYNADRVNELANLYYIPERIVTCINSDYLFCQVINQFKGNNVNNGVYFHNGTITGATAGIDTTDDILDAEDYSFRYAGANYTYTKTGMQANIIDSLSTETGLIGMYCGTAYRYPSYTGTCENKYYYIVPEGNSTKYSTYKLAYAALEKNGFIENIKNYVCFGSSATICPADNLYRIIGAFTFDNGETYHVKLIKNMRYSYSVWNGSQLNTWGSSSLRTTLNQTTIGGYLYTLGTGWQNLIYQATWKVGGNNYSRINNTVSIKTSYTNEMASLGGSNVTYEAKDDSGAYINKAKVGLMYVSDYGYATLPKYWKTDLDNYSNVAERYDWLNVPGWGQWTITRVGNNTVQAYNVNYAGALTTSNVKNDNSGIYPTFYLNTDVEVSSGTGSSTDPWRIKL